MLTGVVLAALVWLVFSPPARVGYAPVQPMKYSHKTHVGLYKMDCLYCHNQATEGKRAGIPSMNSCMNCHTFVGFGTLEGQKVQKIWRDKEQPQWIRINNMPDFVKFSHAVHIKVLLKPGMATKESCLPCHGDIAAMDIVAQVKPQTMGFCVQCHRQYAAQGATLDCSGCHY